MPHAQTWAVCAAVAVACAAGAELITVPNYLENMVGVLPNATVIGVFPGATRPAGSTTVVHASLFGQPPTMDHSDFNSAPMMITPLCFGSDGFDQWTVTAPQIGNALTNTPDTSSLHNPRISASPTLLSPFTQSPSSLTANDINFWLPNDTSALSSVIEGLAASGVPGFTSGMAVPAAVWTNPRVRWFSSAEAIYEADRVATLPPAPTGGGGSGPPRGGGPPIVRRQGPLPPGIPAATQLTLALHSLQGSVQSCVMSGRNISAVTAPLIAHNNLKQRTGEGSLSVRVPLADVTVSPTAYPFWTGLYFHMNKTRVCQVGGPFSSAITSTSTLMTLFFSSDAAVDSLASLFFSEVSIAARAANLVKLYDGFGECNAPHPINVAVDPSLVDITASLALAATADDDIQAAANITVSPTSVAAVEAVANGTAALAVSYAAVSPELRALRPSLRQIPIFNALVTFAFGWQGSNVNAMLIDACVVVGIYNGTFTRWDDAGVVTGMLGITSIDIPAQPIHVFHMPRTSGLHRNFFDAILAIDRKCNNGANTVPTTDVAMAALFGTRLTSVADEPTLIAAIDASYGFGYTSSAFVADYTKTQQATGSLSLPIREAVLRLDGFGSPSSLETVSDAATFGSYMDPATMVVHRLVKSPYSPLIMVAYAVFDSNYRNLPSHNLTYHVALQVTKVLEFLISSRLASTKVSVEHYVWLGGYDNTQALALVRATKFDGADLYPSPTSNLGTMIGIAVGATLGAMLLVIIPTAVVVYRKSTRFVGYAPKDGTKPFAIAFTDIESSTTLWARAPEAMALALDAHHMIIRRVIDKHRGYEVKTIGDAFMVACEKPEDMVRFAVETQEQLYDYDWGTAEFDDIYRALREEAKAAAIEAGEPWAFVDDATLDKPDEYRKLWHGLRVRVGMHFGHGDIIYDETSKGYDYYGSVVNAGSRVEGTCHGGQIVMTTSLRDALPEGWLASQGLRCEPRGSVVLRGFDTPVSLVQVLDGRFADRFFRPLKIDAVPDDADDADEGDEDLHLETASSAGSGFYAGGAAGRDSANQLQLLLSTSKPAFRWDTVIGLCRAWRVGLPPGVEKRRSDVDYVRCVRLLGKRVALVSAETARARENNAASGAFSPPPGGNPLQLSADQGHSDACVSVSPACSVPCQDSVGSAQ